MSTAQGPAALAVRARANGAAAVLLLAVQANATAQEPVRVATPAAPVPAVFDCPPWNVCFWWDSHRDAFVPQPAADPLTAEMRAEVARALRDATHATDDGDLIASCALGLGRMGADRVPFDLATELLPLVAHRNQEVAETAVLALGVGGTEGAIAPLRALADDDGQGRRLCGGGAVTVRTRAFALYGLGFLARRLGSPAAQDAVLEVAGDVLTHAAPEERDLLVAAISALSLLAPPQTGSARWPQLAAAVRRLDAFAARADADLALPQAHVPTAIARLVTTARAGKRGEAERTALEHRAQWLRLAWSLAERPAKDDHALQSALLALAATMPDDDAELARCAAVLVRATADAPDPPCRLLATLALGHTAGPVARARLLVLLASGPGLERSWAAIALGMFEHRARARGGAADSEVARALVDSMHSNDAELVAACTIGAGLARVDDTEPLSRILRRLPPPDDNLLAAVADAARLLDDRELVPDLRTTFAAAQHRPDVRRASAEALVALGDRDVVTTLFNRVESESLGMLSAESLALGAIRDPATVPGLLARLRDDASTPLLRAFMAVALGRIAAGDAANWSAPLAHGTNWMATVPMLSNASSGVLDLL